MGGAEGVDIISRIPEVRLEVEKHRFYNNHSVDEVIEEFGADGYEEVQLTEWNEGDQKPICILETVPDKLVKVTFTEHFLNELAINTEVHDVSAKGGRFMIKSSD
jgi:hypothetical protein